MKMTTNQITSWLSIMVVLANSVLIPFINGKLMNNIKDARHLMADALLFHDHHEIMSKDMQRTLDVVVTECDDATDLFSFYHLTGGVNIYREFYDCSCTGDLTSYFTLTCELKDFCYTDPEYNVTQETCLDRKYTNDISVRDATSSTPFYLLEKSEMCNDYSKNGPSSGPLCIKSIGPCTYELKNEYNFWTTNATEICSYPSKCEKDLSDLGYTTSEIEWFCPNTTLNGIKCNPPSEGSICNDRLFDTIIDYQPDCSNIESCATSSCQEFPLDSEASPKSLPPFIPKYPLCADTSSTEFDVGEENNGGTGKFPVYWSAILVSLITLFTAGCLHFTILA